MKKWKISVLYLGKITANLSLIWPAGMPPLIEDPVLDAPYLGFLLQDGQVNIMVDSGISDGFIVDGKAWGALPAEGGRDFLVQAIHDAGLAPEEINRVIYTHLHNDHAANSGVFTNADLIFQKDEWLNFLNPVPSQKLRGDYDSALIEEIRGARTLMVDGDLDLDDGLRLLKTPGHTLGSQSVAVNTDKGVVVLIGDLCLFDFLIFPGLERIMNMDGQTYPLPPAPGVFGPAVPHAVVYDHFAFYDSIQKVKAVASRIAPGFIIPGHEPSLIHTGI